MAADGITRSELMRRAAAVGLGTLVIPTVSRFDAIAQAAGRSSLTLAIPATPAGWDPDLDFGPVSEDMMQAVHGRLVEWRVAPSPGGGFITESSSIDYRSHIAPSLASNWMIKGDTITFELRKGIESHAGNEITSADVYWSYQRNFGLKAIGAFLNGVSGLASMSDVKMLGKYAISFRLSQPIDIFLMSAGLSHRVVWDKAAVLKHTSHSDPWAATWGHLGDGGCGRWSVGSVAAGNEVVINTFSRYYAGAGPVKTLTLKAVPSDSDRYTLLATGSVDMAYQLQPSEYKHLQGQQGVVVWNFKNVNIAIFQLDANIPPFDNLKVRQAMAYATPYEGILTGVFQGFAKRAGGPIPSEFPGYGTYFSDTYNTNLAKAKSLLAAAGHAKGFSTTIGYNAEDPSQSQMAILMQTNLSQIGVQATLKGLTHAEYTAEQTSQKTSAKLPIMAYIDGPFVPHPYYGLYLNFYSKSPNNWSQTNTPGVDQMLAQMVKTPKFSDAVKIALKAQKAIAENVPWIFVAEPGTQIATRDYVKNVTLDIAYFNYAAFTATA